MLKARKNETQDEIFVRQIASQYSQSVIFVSGHPDAYAILLLQPGRSRVIYGGETTPRQSDDVCAQAFAAGYSTDENRLLLDFRQYTGTINWDYVKKQSAAMSRRNLPPRKIAFVMRDEYAIPTARALALWLRHQETRVFDDIDKAEEWLGWV